MVGTKNFESFHHIADLMRYFSTPRPTDGLVMGVFAASDCENLRQLGCIRNIHFSLRIILILPDSHQATIAEGHKLQPCFIAYVSGDLRKIAAVVGKMIESVQ